MAYGRFWECYRGPTQVEGPCNLLVAFSQQPQGAWGQTRESCEEQAPLITRYPVLIIVLLYFY